MFALCAFQNIFYFKTVWTLEQKSQRKHAVRFQFDISPQAEALCIILIASGSILIKDQVAEAPKYKKQSMPSWNSG